LAYYEFANAIRKRISRKELSADKGREIFGDFKELMSGFEIQGSGREIILR